MATRSERALRDPCGPSGCGHSHAVPPGLPWLSGERVELGFAIAAASTLIIGWSLSLAGSGMADMAWYILLASYFFGGFFAVVESYESLRQGRFEIDFLMVVAACGAGALGEWAEGALLLTLFSIGHALEHYAMGRARKSIASLGKLRPHSAIVLRDGQEQEVPVDSLAIGDVVVVGPDSTIAADGVVIAGESGVDQSPITGESVPVDKSPAVDFHPETSNDQWIDASHRVFAGTINGAGALQVYVTRKTADTTLSRLMQLVTEAESKRSPTQRLTHAFERFYVPAVLVMVLILLTAPLGVMGEPYATTFYRAMAVLVAASPCALAIATPSAVLSAVARAGNSGLLFKGGGPLELLGKVDTIAFDKTGTLTTGKPQLTDIEPVRGVSEERLLATAAAVERLSPHPLARTVWLAARERLGSEAVPHATGLKSLTGQGVQAYLGDQLVSVGSEAMWQQADQLQQLPREVSEMVARLREAGRTIMIIRSGDDFLGVLGLLDVPRPAAANTIQALRELGIRRMVMLSGDHQIVAQQIAHSVGLDEAVGDLMPEEKVQAIVAMNEHALTAMVGDGVNDAPAMASAGVSLAMGAAGSDVALETADVALMGDDLAGLPFAIRLSRQTSKIIRQNLWISLGMIAVLVPATIWGLNLTAAVVFHEGSTVVVVLNALRLLGFRK